MDPSEPHAGLAFGGIGMMQILLCCNAPECDTVARIPIHVGAPLPMVEMSCRTCKPGLMVVEALQGFDQTGRAHAPPQSSPSPPPAIMQPVVSEQMLPEIDAPGGPDFLGSFINRLSPLFVAVEAVALNRVPGDAVSMDKVLAPFKEWSDEIKLNLKRIELQHGIGRGQRLSDGFPSLDPNKGGPLNIALRNLFGSNGKKITKGGGILQQMGVLEYENATTYVVGENALKFAGMFPTPLHGILGAPELKPLGIVGDNPPMLAFFDEETAASMLNLVFELVPDEKAWALHILETMKTHSDENGWNSNTYAQNMALYLNNGAGHQDRWQKNGRPLAEYYRDLGERKKEKSPSWFAEERLRKNINAALGGLFGRLKELGLIYPIGIGITKNYALTEQGERFLEQFSEEGLI